MDYEGVEIFLPYLHFSDSLLLLLSFWSESILDQFSYMYSMFPVKHFCLGTELIEALVMDNKHKWQDIIFQRDHVSGMSFYYELYYLYQALNLVSRRLHIVFAVWAILRDRFPCCFSNVYQISVNTTLWYEVYKEEKLSQILSIVQCVH